MQRVGLNVQSLITNSFIYSSLNYRDPTPMSKQLVLLSLTLTFHSDSPEICFIFNILELHRDIGKSHGALALLFSRPSPNEMVVISKGVLVRQVMFLPV